jgi:hypothetical protein
MSKEAYIKIEEGLKEALSLVERMPFVPGFGLHAIVDWDAVAMTEIEGINSQPVGGIDRSASPMWRAKGY